MNSRPLVIITTRLPPQVCGIGTYSWLLHRHWSGGHARVEFFVIDSAAESVAALNYPSITQFDGKPRALWTMLDRIGAADVLLHYAGRAYHRYGVPRWLPSVVAQWKNKFPGGRLLIFFHELPGNLPMTSRHFWIDMFNRRVISKLARLADDLVTNTTEHVAKLKQITGRSDVHLVPVPSNIEPPTGFPSPRARTEMAVFGLPFGRWQTLQLFDSRLRQWQTSGRLTKLHIVGPNDDKFSPQSRELVRTWPNTDIVVDHGILSPAGVSGILSHIRFGLSNANAETWSKSAVFMAYAAHGCAIIAEINSQAEPLRFVVGPEEVLTISDIDLAARTASLKNWYERNANWSVVAQQISALLPLNIREVAIK
jgi:hypothetical protein